MTRSVFPPENAYPTASEIMRSQRTEKDAPDRSLTAILAVAEQLHDRMAVVEHQLRHLEASLCGPQPEQAQSNSEGVDPTAVKGSLENLSDMLRYCLVRLERMNNRLSGLSDLM